MFCVALAHLSAASTVLLATLRFGEHLFLVYEHRDDNCVHRNHNEEGALIVQNFERQRFQSSMHVHIRVHEPSIGWQIIQMGQAALFTTLCRMRGKDEKAVELVSRGAGISNQLLLLLS